MSPVSTIGIRRSARAEELQDPRALRVVRRPLIRRDPHLRRRAGDRPSPSSPAAAARSTGAAIDRVRSNSQRSCARAEHRRVRVRHAVAHRRVAAVAARLIGAVLARVEHEERRRACRRRSRDRAASPGPSGSDVRPQRHVLVVGLIGGGAPLQERLRAGRCARRCRRRSCCRPRDRPRSRATGTPRARPADRDRSGTARGGVR